MGDRFAEAISSSEITTPSKLNFKSPKSPFIPQKDENKADKFVQKTHTQDPILSRSQRKLIAYLKAQFDEDITNIQTQMRDHNHDFTGSLQKM